MNAGKDIILGRKFFQRDTSLVARELLGKVLVRISRGKYASGVIIETEAYYGTSDPASHACRGITPRSSIMFGKAGVAYVYLCYGVYWLLNVVTEVAETPGAVLIRGLRPQKGKKIMQQRRKISGTEGLADGPGKLTIAMEIDGSDNGVDMTSSKDGLFFTPGPVSIGELNIKNTARIGISEGKDRMLRYVAVGL